MADSSYDDDDLSEDYDNFDDDESIDMQDLHDMRKLGANKELFGGLQARKAKSYQKVIERVSNEVREGSGELKQVKNQRVELGVNLYNSQQQLAKMQVELKAKIDQLAEVARDRVESEELSAQVEKDLKAQKKLLGADEHKFSKEKAQLDKLREQVQLMEMLNEKISVEVAVLRRRAYANEVGLKESEKNKSSQDYFINDLTEEISSLRQKQTLLESRLKEQSAQTQDAQTRLKVAQKDMSEIEFEKNQLRQEWKASLVGIERRDLALQATNDALSKLKEKAAEVDAELEGYKLNIRSAQKLNEEFQVRYNKTEVDTSFIEKELQKLADEQDKASERYDLLKRSLDNTDEELKRVNMQKKSINSMIRDYDQNYRTVLAEKQKLEDTIEQNASTQTTVSKAVTNMKKQQRQARNRVREKEADKVVLENEVAKMQVDALNTQAHCESLKKTRSQCLAELKTQDTLIEKYQLEIRQRHDDVEKKMYIVDRLNRKYEALTANKEDVNHGPLEATIKNMDKQLSKTKSENQEIQRDWLKAQTDLVKISAEMDSLSDDIRNNTSKLTVLEQKQLRVNDKIATARREVHELERGLKQMHDSMDKLNSLISRNKELRDKLKSSAEYQEQEFVAELAELQEQSIQLQTKYEDVREERNKIDAEILETQELLNLYEKKIQQEQEMQEMLDPNVGQKEAQEMEKAIHRMKIKLAKLQRDQKDLIQQIEMAIDKREALATRFRGKKDKGNSNVKKRKEAATLRRNIKSTNEEIMKKDKEVKLAEQELEDKEKVANQMSSEQQQIELEVAEMQENINDMLYQKQRVVDSNAMMHRLLRKYKALNAPRPPPPASPRSTVRLLSTAEEEKAAVLRCVAALQEEFPHIGDVLGRVGALTQIEIPI